MDKTCQSRTFQQPLHMCSSSRVRAKLIPTKRAKEASRTACALLRSFVLRYLNEVRLRYQPGPAPPKLGRVPVRKPAAPGYYLASGECTGWAAIMMFRSSRPRPGPAHWPFNLVLLISTRTGILSGGAPDTAPDPRRALIRIKDQRSRKLNQSSETAC